MSTEEHLANLEGRVSDLPNQIRNQFNYYNRLIAVIVIVFVALQGLLYYQGSQTTANLNAQLAQMDKRLADMQRSVDSRLGQMDTRLDALNKQLIDNNQAVLFELSEVRGDIGRVEGRLSVLEEIRAGVQKLGAASHFWPQPNGAEEMTVLPLPVPNEPAPLKPDA